MSNDDLTTRDEAGTRPEVTASAPASTEPQPEVTTPAPTATEPAPEVTIPAPTATLDERSRRTGPAPVTVVIGLLCIAVAALAFTSEVTDLQIDWAAVGPVVVLGIGAVLILLGLLGMRRRRD